MPYLQHEVNEAQWQPIKSSYAGNPLQNYQEALQLLGGPQRAIHTRAELSHLGWHGILVKAPLTPRRGT